MRLRSGPAFPERALDSGSGFSGRAGRVVLRNTPVPYFGRGCVIVMVLLLLGSVLGAEAAGVDKRRPSMQLTIGKVAWLAGNWRMEKNGRISEEQWMTPAGGRMLGMGRSTLRGKPVDHRFLQLHEGPGGSLFLIVHGSGWKETVFPMKTLTDTAVTFENQQDEFPQTITYTLQPDGSLGEAMEGQGADQVPKRIEYVFQRTNP